MKRARLLMKLEHLAFDAVWVVLAIGWLTDSTTVTRSPTSDAFGLVALWPPFWLVGGLMAAFGLLWPSLRFRLGGLIFISTGLLMAFVASLAAPHFDVRGIAYFLLGVSALARCGYLSWCVDAEEC